MSASVQFLCSYPSYASLPFDDGLEVAFAGRSNAGKSSVLNALCGRKALARISSAPGKTRHINIFGVDRQRKLVDLPGYGYAKASESEQRRWRREITRYVTERKCLLGLVIVMDVRHPLRETDRTMLALCRASKRRVHVLLNKSDKLNPSQRYASLEKARENLSSLYPDASCNYFSALKREGLAELQRVLSAWFKVNSSDFRALPPLK